MLEKQYYGELGQYGPYTPQPDGWPHAGEVIRDYRKRVKKISAATLARLYSEALEDEPVSERWIQMIEKQNKLPHDMRRRTILASVLGIPPILLGLGSLSQLQPQTSSKDSFKKQVDLQAETSMLDLYWSVDHSSTAQFSIANIEHTISQLKTASTHVSGYGQKHIFEVLCGYYTLISTIYADICNYEKALAYANEAVSLSQHMENNKLIAASLYQRGFVRQEQATYTTTLNSFLLESAIADFHAALPLATPKVEAHIQLDLALSHALLRRSGAAEISLNKAGLILDRGSLDEGTFLDHFADVNKGRYRLGQAVVYTTLKRYEDAEELLFEAKEGISPVHTRRLAWAEAVESKIYLGQRNYPLAIQSALLSLKSAKAINSLATIHILRGVHTELLKTNYANTTQVRGLGVALIAQ